MPQTDLYDKTNRQEGRRGGTPVTTESASLRLFPRHLLHAGRPEALFSLFSKLEFRTHQAEADRAVAGAAGGDGAAPGAATAAHAAPAQGAPAGPGVMCSTLVHSPTFIFPPSPV